MVRIQLYFDRETFSNESTPLLHEDPFNHDTFEFSIFDLLFAIGRMTTPSIGVEWDFRSFYSFFKYSWAILDTNSFKLDDRTRLTDVYLKCSMSSDFGAGFCGLVMSRYFHCDFLGHTAELLYHRPRRIAINTMACPDFIGINDDGEIMLFESKGTQGSLSYHRKQLKDGKENQVSRFQDEIPIPGFVVATLLSRESRRDPSRISVIDPINNTNIISKRISARDIIRNHYERILGFTTGVYHSHYSKFEVSIRRQLFRMIEQNPYLSVENEVLIRRIPILNIPQVPWSQGSFSRFEGILGIPVSIIDSIDSHQWDALFEGYYNKHNNFKRQETSFNDEGQEILYQKRFRDGHIESLVGYY